MTPSKEARTAAAEHLGYRDWEDATDHRLTGAQDRERDRLAAAFDHIIRQTEAATMERAAGIADAYAEKVGRPGRKSAAMTIAAAIRSAQLEERG